jgi:hypothetical protein
MTVKRTSPAKVNKALRACGIDHLEIVRGNGYYWFCDTGRGDSTIYPPVPSIWQNSLLGWTTQDVLDRVNEAFTKAGWSEG